MLSQVQAPSQIRHALCLHLYQPEGNLLALLGQYPDELQRILLCYERIGRHVQKYASVARLQIALSPVLLQQLRDPQLIDACRQLADIPAILDSLRSAPGIEFVASGYRHAPLPLIPQDDWEEQLSRERSLLESVLGRRPHGYWPPAGHFQATMIPALLSAGYRYLLLPIDRLRAADGSTPDPFRAYRLHYQDSVIDVVPIDSGFSAAQEYGLEAAWFADQTRAGVAQALPSDAPYLVTTWSDAENGDWFRRQDEENGFFGRFFSPYMEFCETGEYPVRPVLLSEYLTHHPATQDAQLSPDPAPFVLDPTLRDFLHKVAQHYWSVARSPGRLPEPRLRQARELILSAEDSAYLLDHGRHSSVFLMLEQALAQLRDAEREATAIIARPLPSPAFKPVVRLPQPTIPEPATPARPSTPVEPAARKANAARTPPSKAAAKPATAAKRPKPAVKKKKVTRKRRR